MLLGKSSGRENAFTALYWKNLCISGPMPLRPMLFGINCISWDPAKNTVTCPVSWRRDGEWARGRFSETDSAELSLSVFCQFYLNPVYRHEDQVLVGVAWASGNREVSRLDLDCWDLGHKKVLWARATWFSLPLPEAWKVWVTEEPWLSCYRGLLSATGLICLVSSWC